jgi:hypothetical protein
MKYFISVVVLFQLFFVQAQELKTAFFKDYSLKADRFIGVDDFGNSYYINQNSLYKKTAQTTYSYANSQLGEITSVDITNPLKVLVFYRDFNTVLLLDNRLNELTLPINFTTESFSKNITFTSVSSNNNLWLYSFDDHILQLWNHQTRKIQFTSQPLNLFIDDFKPIRQFSTYKSCWLVDQNNILKFNEYGSFIESYEVNNSDLTAYDKGYIILENNKLFYQGPSRELTQIDLNPAVNIKSFYVNTNHIYIFDGTKIFVFKIIKI